MLIPILIALIGTSLLNIGFLLQKSEASLLPSFKDQTIFHSFKTLLKCRKWILGTFLTVLGWVLFLIAVSLAPLSVIAPLNNVGVVVLAIFALIWLNETLQMYEWIGFISILIGVISISLFPPTPGYSASLFDHPALLILTALFLIGLFFLKIVQTVKFPSKTGLIFGITAGITAGLGATYTKLLGLVLDEITVVIFVFLLVILFQIISFISLQNAFKKDRAMVVVPLFNSFSALLPVIFGIGVFYEIISIEQLIGIALIIIGTSLLFKISEASSSLE